MGTRVRRRLTGAAVLAALVPGLVLGGTGGSASAAGTGDDRIRVVQHNTDMGGPWTAMEVARSWGDVDAITFQELCEAQMRKLRSQGWKVLWRSQKGGNDKCGSVDGKRRKGNAVVTKRRIKSTEVVELGTYGGRRFRMLCAHLGSTGVPNTTVCTTHLALGYQGGSTHDDDGKANRAAQVAIITAKTDQWVFDGRRVVLTGDFNEGPTGANIERLQRVESNGTTDTDKFWEGDQADDKYCAAGTLCRNMAPTTDGKRKIDYFFASHRSVNPHTGLSKGIVPSRTAGHHIVRGQVTFKPL